MIHIYRKIYIVKYNINNIMYIINYTHNNLYIYINNNYYKYITS